MSQSVPGLVSHTRRVKSLYKKALRNLESWYDRRDVFRYYAVMLRKTFDDNQCVRDMIVAKELLERGEAKLFKRQHWHVKQFPESPGGTAYLREVPPPDWVVDYWHPLEKQQYPEYFARREHRKREFLRLWSAKYGSQPTCPQ